ncbi:vWA domain-containing protein [Treponema pallidum]|uniref:Uncharacterized protein TP_0750 n=4 Tax=Treponema pallidum TaxID=160 RepID=Y750_TREPA|nr:vWA domain-containing protein [Treponema pallidum]O83731.1 RecName: Full=Uncharacterized protein TP_0750; Flags: Precursor [Treponema pallidum subsp. pallidum str. Nichols]AAC65716.1 hypothetical protein TP_0750 [Treponema pallidum subsp. pallidum str. Nichols]ACD71168.1 hypothetical protein TPASS_0750 [Treponema pallidum subsp. pallidum SS14]ADD72846.1 conserved hypothetical protein [Treponema pallidum subsp. pallidum str. Chicago]AEZ57877.1 von Willebrand factor type A domain protein [Tre
MHLKKALCPALCTFLIHLCLHAGERTVPVDIFLMIDKSRSMQEPGKFSSLHRWVRDEFVSSMTIQGDWITVYQFYEKPEELITLTLRSEQDRDKIISVVDSIVPNGRYTDIGRALDTVWEIQEKRKDNNRHKVLLLVTDLEHDAPLTSKYRGKQRSFQSPYLVRARRVKHDNWYEITLDMAVHDRVAHTARELYRSIAAAHSKRPTPTPPAKESSPRYTPSLD